MIKWNTNLYFGFAKNARLLLENNKFGLYNLVCRGNTSRYEVAKEI